MIRPTKMHALFLGLVVTASAGDALAQDPTFKNASEEELKELEKAKKKPEWKANALAGLVLTTGNARTTTLSAGAKASRKANKNKFQLEASGAYARASIFVANDANGNGAIGPNEFSRDSQTTARTLEGKARYDRFLSDMDALYLSAQALTNKPAGKNFLGGGQAGYSRTAFTDDKHTLVVEAGYDFSYEDPVSGNGFSNHSLRAFAGYESKLSEDSGLDASVESLFNVNELETPVGPADRFEDARFTGKLSLTTKLFEDISFRFGFEAKYDNVPSPLPAFAIPFEEVVPAQKLDTKTEANLIINFL